MYVANGDTKFILLRRSLKEEAPEIADVKMLKHLHKMYALDQLASRCYTVIPLVGILSFFSA